jgi:putative ABC transport system permease protein
MFSNYLKITWAVMQRRKAYTFLSLFGISFTLMVLIVLAAFLHHVIGPNYPEWGRNNTLYILAAKMDFGNNSTRMGPLSYSFFERFVKTLKTPEKTCVITIPSVLTAYPNGKRVVLRTRHTDAGFWEICQFDFLEGRAYTQKDISSNRQGVVINEQTREAFFGKSGSALGREIEVDGAKYQVLGVVKGVPMTRLFSFGDVYFPVNTIKYDLKNPEYMGSFWVMLKAKDQANMEQIRAEYSDVVRKVPVQKTEKFDSQAYGYLGGFADTFFRLSEKSSLRLVYGVLILFAFLFMSLPAINLININVSRIMERASEIGIRKAFGATSKALTRQFIVENIILTAIGGILALIFAAIILAIFNRSGLIPNADLRINWFVVLVALIVTLVFGLLSGVLPAWRMSKLQSAEALRISA